MYFPQKSLQENFDYLKINLYKNFKRKKNNVKFDKMNCERVNLVFTNGSFIKLFFLEMSKQNFFIKINID